MMALALDSTGDIDFDANTGVFNTVNDNDEIVQHLNLLLGINLGELTWNDEIGLDQNDVMINGDNESIVQSILDDYLQAQLGESYEGIEVTDFSVDREQRLSTLSATVTMDGETFNAAMALDNGSDDEGDDDNATNS
ncbi:hypothetical protein [Lactobacillus buchneri CD034] [Lactiplantibacillus mudanjiangensis]|uniref:hypothetical protein n=1 Tax=Lactiplantibacillus mudanjiangensis TaxID=1296538 RepID=UPI00101476EB|nr:hypothetical protein [Lactiplantibacillus mudanjiangensis]VDG31417.1 hypothetical protein [Lactobacillus buchneri CD034] [Lactiplantibacillus mudanjiangensis]